MALVIIVVELAVSARYGFHRDELYFLQAGRHLDWGFVDQPPLVPLLARIVESVAGASPTALRVLSAFALGSVVLVAAATARRFGGSRRAQLLAGMAAGGGGYALAAGHLFSTSTFDYLLWTIALYLIVGLLDGDNPRRWLLVGLVFGVGMQNKHLIGLLAVAILIGILATERRRLLASPWPWLGSGIAMLIALPNILWQMANDWPQLEMARALAERSAGPIAFVLEQIGLLSIVLIVPAAIGWWQLTTSRDMRQWRPIGIAAAVLFVFFLLTGGKSYYQAGIYPVLLAAASRWFDHLSQSRQKGWFAAAGIGIAVGAFIALPLVPASFVSNVDATGELGESVGWPELIDQIDDVYLSIPEALRSETVIFTGSYGEAGAVDTLGPERGLPPASSGHNSYWSWGPPEQHGPIIGVGGIGSILSLICPGSEQVGEISNPYGVNNEENGLPLWLCLDPDRQLSDIWPQVKHYN